MKKILLILLATGCISTTFSQNIYQTNAFSDQYYGKVYVENSEEVFSAGWIAIYEKGSDKELIRVESDELAVDYTEKGEVKTNVKELPYGEQSVIIYEDFNFDGIKDFAIQEGQNSCYHGPSYEIYLARNNGFVFSPSFTSLAQEYCGMFNVNYEDQTISTMTKSGCCWHQFCLFDIVNNNPRLIQSVVEDAFNPYFYLTTIETWDEQKQRMNKKEYRSMDEESLEVLFSFVIEKNNKKVILFEAHGSLMYAFTKDDQKVEYYYPNDRDESNRFVYNKRLGSETIEFSNASATYKIYNTPAKVGIEVTTNGKVYDMKGKVSSRYGKLSAISSKSLDNVKKSN